MALLEYLPPSHQRGHILVRLLSANKLVAYVIAHVASVSVKFRGKKRTRKWILGFDRARNETRAKKWKTGEGVGGRGEGKKEGNACRQTLRFWKSAFASERSAWLAQLVEQYWHVSIKGLFHTGRSCVVRDTHLRASLHGGGGPQIGEVTCGGSPHLPCKRGQIKMKDYMDRRATPPKRVTSPNWGLPPACKQALNFLRLLFILVGK